MDYLFKSMRLGFKPWNEEDFENLLCLCSNAEVMRYFPSTLDLEGTRVFFNRLQAQYHKYGCTYFATYLLDSKTFIGFIGLQKKQYSYLDGGFAVDIGWRLLPPYWRKGYALEGANQCLRYGFENLLLSEIIAIAPAVNVPSISLMKRLGMQFDGAFVTTELPKDSPLQPLQRYLIQDTDFMRQVSQNE